MRGDRGKAYNKSLQEKRKEHIGGHARIEDYHFEGRDLFNLE